MMTPEDKQQTWRMSPEAKQQQMGMRNAAICEHYTAGNNLASCGKKFNLRKQRIMQILKDGGVWKPYIKGERTEYLGIHVKPSTKVVLREAAEKQGISVSKLSAEYLDELAMEANDHEG